MYRCDISNALVDQRTPSTKIYEYRPKEYVNRNINKEDKEEYIVNSKGFEISKEYKVHPDIYYFHKRTGKIPKFHLDNYGKLVLDESPESTD